MVQLGRFCRKPAGFVLPSIRAPKWRPSIRRCASPRRERYWTHAPVTRAASAPDITACYQAPPTPAADSDATLGSVSELMDERTEAPPETTPRTLRRRSVSEETRRKISLSMSGVPKSREMRAKLSASMKESMRTRPPWNKGKTLSPETRRRMSESRRGRTSWNKGVPHSPGHRQAIAVSRMKHGSEVADSTRRLLQLARRRPGDGIVAGSSAARANTRAGDFPLVDTADINEYVSLRRSLRGWSDAWAQVNGRRPALSDVRRVAPPSLVRDFERYVQMRDAIRGLAVDVYGSVNAADVPVVPTRNSAASGPSNNNAERRVRTTKRGNVRLASDAEVHAVQGGQVAHVDCEDASALEALGVSDSRDDMWDDYDAPVQRPDRAAGFGSVDQSLVGVHEIAHRPYARSSNGLSMNDYRLIGKYRLMESIDIHKFVQLRRELERWSAAFKKRTGKTPALSDVRDRENSGLYTKFCKYLDMRQNMSGLMKEVYRTNIDDLQDTVKHVNEAGRSVLDVLRSSS